MQKRYQIKRIPQMQEKFADSGQERKRQRIGKKKRRMRKTNRGR